MVYKQNNLRQGSPYKAKRPTARPLDVSTMTDEQFHAELEKGVADVTAGRTRPATEVLKEIHWDYGL